MSEADQKYTCTTTWCAWHGLESELLKAVHPFDKDDEVYGCPECKDMTIACACDEDGCWEPSTGGFPVEDDYRRTCGKHFRKANHD